MKTTKPARVINPAIPRLTTSRLRPSHPRASTSENDEKPTLAVAETTGTDDTKSRVSDPRASTSEKNEKPKMATPEVAPQNMTRLRLKLPRVSTSENDQTPLLAINEFAGARVTRSRLSDPKASASQYESASQSESRRPTRTGRVAKSVKRIDNMPKSRRIQLFFPPKDEIILLQICVKLKDVISWGKIRGFWTMVQDTLQLKTGKEYKKVSRHVGILIDKRRAEQQEIEQEGKISISRVSAGCRPLLDKWIEGGNVVHHSSPNISTTLTSIEDEDDMSLGEEVGEQLDSNDFALEVQKKSATDAWLDTTCDTTRYKNLKLCTSEPTSGTSKSCADSIGCWSLSGSSVTNDSSLEDGCEDSGEDENPGPNDGQGSNLSTTSNRRTPEFNDEKLTFILEPSATAHLNDEVIYQSDTLISQSDLVIEGVLSTFSKVKESTSTTINVGLDAASGVRPRPKACNECRKSKVSIVYVI